MSERKTWRNLALVGMFGMSLAAACTVGSGTDGPTDNDGGSTSTGGSKGGSTSGGATTGGKAGATAGGTGGASTGGATTGGTAGTGGTGGGTSTDATCNDVSAGGYMVAGTPQPDCEPTTAGDPCQECIKTNCCEEYKNCGATDPYNVCAWGGADDWATKGGEILCFQDCINTAYDPTGSADVITPEMIGDCYGMCATPKCGGVIGDETDALATCMVTNCAGTDQCFQ